MRILHVPHAYYPVLGGAELICKRVSEILVEQGHDVQVLTTDAGAVQAYYEFGVASVIGAEPIVEGVPVKRLNFSDSLYQAGGWANSHLRPRWLGRRLAAWMRQYLNRRLDRAIAGEIARFRPDVVMTMPHLVVNVQSVISARSQIDFPLVMVPMLHEHDPNIDIPATAKGLSFADAVIALTVHEAERLAAAYGVGPENIFMASVGIDLDRDPPTLSDRPKRVVFLGRQVRSKGIGDLIEAMRLIWPDHPDAELAIAGIRVPESIEIDDQIATLPAAWRGRVKDYGRISEADKAKILRSARCLVLPSKTESFGMVILDAWAQQTPAITWDLPVFRSIVDDEETGLLVDPNGGAVALAGAIGRLLDAPDEAARIGRAGYRKAVETYSWTNVSAVYLQAYDHAVRRRQAMSN
ncbi:MAG: glycosyltransferase family 4 protein [Xanthobacteraceae bacterium]